MSTRAPAAEARSAVRSVDPPSTTITSPSPWFSNAATQGPIAVSSLRQGMMADTFERSADRAALGPGAMVLQAPAQPAACAGFRRRVGLQRCAEMLVGFTVPDFPQGLLRGVAEGIIFVALLGERRDTARQGAAIGGEIHHGPRAPA